MIWILLHLELWLQSLYWWSWAQDRQHGSTQVIFYPNILELRQYIGLQFSSILKLLALSHVFAGKIALLHLNFLLWSAWEKVFWYPFEFFCKDRVSANLPKSQSLWQIVLFRVHLLSLTSSPELQPWRSQISSSLSWCWDSHSHTTTPRTGPPTSHLEPVEYSRAQVIICKQQDPLWENAWFAFNCLKVLQTEQKARPQ